MLFSSLTFIFYFLPVTLLLYYVFRFSKVLKNTVLLAASLLFYAWGHVSFVFILLASVMANYIFALLVDAFRTKRIPAKIVLFFMCVFNLSILFAFKYLGFSATVVNDIFHTSFPIIEFLQPVGISFFTFKAISYVVDVYRGKADVQKNPFYVALYLSLFPHIEAGPVVLYACVADQIEGRTENMRMFSVGCCRFVTGLAKKVLIANHMSTIINNIYDISGFSPLPATLAWVGSIAYSLQIYYDLSGYSDMAIGLGLMFGFKIPENFNYPYAAKSFTDFWARWQMSLIGWFKEYVYAPLSASKQKNNDTVMKNLFVVWLLIGVWHGAEWTFLICGLAIFVFIALEKLLYIDKITTHTILRRIYTLFFINILWVIFRSDSLTDAGNYIAAMFGANGLHSPYSLMFIKENIVFFVAGIIFATPIARKMNKSLVNNAPLSPVLNAAYPSFMVVLFLICVSYLVKDVQYPFIYFNF